MPPTKNPPRRSPHRRQKRQQRQRRQPWWKRLGRGLWRGLWQGLWQALVWGLQVLDALTRRFKRLPRQTRQICLRLAAASLTLTTLAFAFLWWRNSPPGSPEDLCAIFQEKRSWYRAAKTSFEQWGVSEPIQLAIMYQESSFKARVKPPRRRILWIFPGPRPSTAFGFSQALDGTWLEYQQSTGRLEARRDDFADAAYFVGWYGHQTHRQIGVAKNDAYSLYLAYHEGAAGFARGSHNKKAWLLKTARRVEKRAGRYEEQYLQCRDRLAKWWAFW